MNAEVVCVTSVCVRFYKILYGGMLVWYTMAIVVILFFIFIIISHNSTDSWLRCIIIILQMKIHNIKNVIRRFGYAILMLARICYKDTAYTALIVLLLKLFFSLEFYDYD